MERMTAQLMRRRRHLIDEAWRIESDVNVLRGFWKKPRIFGEEEDR
jgi:hypothetical protein